MRSDDDDIREIFRRAFEQRDRPEPEREREPRPPRPPSRPILPPNWQRDRRLWVGGLLLLLIVSFSSLVTLYTDWLWFREVGYEAIWWRGLIVRTAIFAAALLLALLVLWGNARLALNMAQRSAGGRFVPAAFAGFRFLVWGAGLVLAWLFASAARVNWETVLRYLFQAPTETTDPIFGRSLTFYFFNLPLYDFVRGWLLTLIVFTAAGVVAIYAAHNLESIRRGAWRPQELVPLRRHIAALAGVAALLIAVGHYLARYDLLFSQNGFVIGIGHTDFTITARVYLLSALLMLGIAVTLFYNAYRLDLRSVLVLLGIWLFSTVVLGGVLPSLYQTYAVAPNEFTREQRFIAHNIDYSRMAYQLNQVEARDFGQVTDLTRVDLAQNAAALQNIRLWDYRVLPRNYQQLQSLRPFYEFSGVDIDRYLVNGQMRQVMLAARELNKARLPNDTWVNRKLEFTHGYGLVMNLVDRFTADGQPDFIISDIPVSAVTDVRVTRPQVYYGEKMNDVVYAGSAREEVDYVSGAQYVRSRYSGVGGVPAGNLLRRVAFAVRFGDINLLLSNDITPTTRIMYNRQIIDRVRQIAPFLSFDYDPYLVVSEEGRLVWIVDGYTTSRRYPYSEPIGMVNDAAVRQSSLDTRANYIRNVVKITIDAYDGAVHFYQIDMADPIASAYARAYPDLFRPIDAMPADLQRHLRYPETLFRVQSQQYAKYQMTDAAVFYNQGDLWAIPQGRQTGSDRTLPMEPYYVIFRLPGEPQTEYLLIQPYTPANRNNMVAWIAGRSDPPNYGQLVVYKWEDPSVFGPLQIEGRIDQDPRISEQVTLWDQSGSQVIRGNLLVIPLNNSFLYVEPLYLQASTEGSALPELKRVIVANRTNLVMANTLAEALAGLVNTSVSSVVQWADLAPPTETTEPAEPGAPPPIEDETLQALIQQANTHFEAAEAAQRAGDWATYGTELEQLQTVLARLLALIEE